jgi:hypothetical protein
MTSKRGVGPPDHASLLFAARLPSQTDSEKFARGTDFVILRRSRRIWAPNWGFLSLAAQILRSAQDDKRSARINRNSQQPDRADGILDPFPLHVYLMQF